MTVQIVTDSTVDLPLDVIKELGIEVVPLTVVIGNQAFKEGIEISKDEFYERLTHNEISTSTSAPSIGDFQYTYESISEKNLDIISIHLSSKLSATYNNALKAAENLPRHNNEINIIDSKSTSMAMGFIVTAAAILANKGASIEEIKNTVERSIPRVHLVFTLNTLDYLRKGGRIGPASAFLGSMLSIKPILSLRNGEVNPEKKVRSRAKSIDEMIEFVNLYPNIDNIAVGYSTDLEEANLLRDRLMAGRPNLDIWLTKLGPVIGAHTGPGVLGIGLIEEGS